MNSSYLKIILATAATAATLASSLFLCACERHAESSEVASAPAPPPSNEITLAPQAVELAKIRSSVVNSQSGVNVIKTTGEIKAAEPKIFHINSLVVGRVVADKANLGDVIHQGQTLAVVQNLDVTKIAGEYIHELHQNEVQQKELLAKLDLANKNLDRLDQLNKDGIAPQKDLIMARNAKDLLEIDLAGVKEHVIHIQAETEAMLAAYGVKMDKNPDPSKVPTGSPLRSPRSGVIIEKTITLGDVVNTTAPLYVVADLSEVWLDINIYDKDIASIAIGEPVTFKSDSLAGRTFQGTVSYIQPQAGNAHTFIARAVFQNPTRILKPGMFGQVELSKFSNSMGAYVPDSALEKYNGEDFVFVDKGSGHFEKRKVELSDRTSDGYLVRSGIKSGERIVTAGALTLKAELYKNQAGED